MRETFIKRKGVLKIWSPNNWNLKYLYETEPACNGKNLCSLGFCFRQVSLYKTVYKTQHPVRYFYLRQESKIPVFGVMTLSLDG